MAYTFAYRGLPTTLGSTVVQANALISEVNSFVSKSAIEVHQIVDPVRGKYFSFPGAKEYPLWQFYIREDLAGSDAIFRTIAAIKVTKVKEVNVLSDATSLRRYNRDEFSYIVEVRVWDHISGTGTNGEVTNKIAFHSVTDTMFEDPELRILAVPANAYQGIHQCLSFLLKPVAAGAPLWTPMQTAIGRGNPNSV